MGSNNEQVIRFFATTPHECSYIADEEARTLFADPNCKMDSALYSRLSHRGFRRSGRYVYRPYCNSCNQCIPTRIPVSEFKPSRSQRRNLKRNADLRVEVRRSVADNAFYSLYEKYINTRHRDGDMFPATEEQYASFLSAEWGITRYAVFYAPEQAAEKPIAVAVFDELEDGLSAIYTFFDPDFEQRGLGTYAVLWQIEMARQIGLEHLYLGYWIKACEKMAYKSKFRPLELLVNDRWTIIT